MERTRRPREGVCGTRQVTRRQCRSSRPHTRLPPPWPPPQYLESDADEQLILHIPFKDNVKLKSIAIVGEGGDMHPSSMKAFKNRDDIDFDNVRALHWATCTESPFLGSQHRRPLFSRRPA